MEEFSFRRLRTIAASILLGCVIPAIAVGQLPLKQNENLIVIAKRNLEEAREDFAERLAKLKEAGLLQPGNDEGIPIDQDTWEALPYIEGDLPAPVFAAFKTPAEKRTESQQQILYHYYLSHVRKDTRPDLKSASNRIHWLERYVKASNEGDYNAGAYQSAIQLFYRQQYLDAYLFYTTDSPRTQRRACDLFRNIAADRANLMLGSPEVREKSRLLENLDGLDPVLSVATIDQRMFERPVRYEDPRERQLKDAINTFEERECDPFLKFQARHALYRWKTLQRGKILSTTQKGANWNWDDPVRDWDDPIALAFVKEVNELTDLMLADAMEVMRDVEDSPELSRTIFYVMGKTMKIDSLKKRNEFLKQVADSDLKPWLKAYLQQFINLSIASYSGAKDYYQESIEHGKEALELMPLSPEPALRLMTASRSAGTFEESKEWFHEALGRQIDSHDVIKAFCEIATQADDPTAEITELLVGLSNSPRYDLEIPDNVLLLLRRFKNASHFKEICQEKEVQKALERVVAGRTKAGGDPEWLKQARLLQVEVGMRGGDFERAFTVGKLLGDDFYSKYVHHDRPLTLARMACLGKEIVESTEEKIDKRILLRDEIPLTIKELKAAREDFESMGRSYTDELIALLESIRQFESGEWADLAKSNEHLLCWKTSTSNCSRIKSLKDGMQTFDPYIYLRWRWTFDSPYVLEADVHFAEDKKKGAKKVKKAGFCINPLTVESHFFNLTTDYSGLSRGWPRGSVRFHRFRESEAGNRMRVRVWPDYCDFSVDNEKVFHQVKPFETKYGARLFSYTPNTQFRNIRIRKIPYQSPAAFRTDPIEYWTARIENEPDASELYQFRGQARIRGGVAQNRRELLTQGIEDFRRMVELFPDYPEAVEGLIHGLVHAERYADAKKEAVAGAKKFYARRQMKVMLAALACTSPDPKSRNGAQAVKLTERLLKSPSSLNKTKLFELAAAAHAEVGQFNKAIEFQKEAIALQPDRVRLTRILADYEKKKPLRGEFSYFYDRFDAPGGFEGPRKSMEVTEGLVRHWKFDADMSEAVTKSKGRGSGSSRLVGGLCRGALLLGEGRGGDMVHTNSKSIDPDQNFTISFWVNRMNSQGGLLSVSPQGSNAGLFVYLHSGELRFRCQHQKYLSTKVLGEAGKNKKLLKLKPRQWVHFTLTFDSQKSLYETWMDGVKITEAEILPGDSDQVEVLDLDSLQVKFGNCSDFFGFNGMLDEVRIYDRVLDDDEIKAVLEYRP